MDVYTSGKDAPPGSPAQELYTWIMSLHELMDLLCGPLTEERWSHTYRAPSLKRLEGELLWFFEQDSGEGDLGAMFIECAAGYFGETLLNDLGGRWAWDESAGTAGLSVVCPDPVLKLESIVPMDVVGRALREQTGTVFAETARGLRTAVRAHRRKKGNEGWQPERIPTPWIAKENLESVSLARRLQHWDNYCYNVHRNTWADEAGGGVESWNLQPESLDAMEALLRKNFATVEEYDEVAAEDFWEQAAWYVGHYVECRKGAQWQYLEVNPDAAPGTLYAADSHWTGSAFIRQRYRYDGHAEHPWEMLREVLSGASLREIVDRFPDPRGRGDYGR